MHTRKAEAGAVDLKARSMPVVVSTDYPVERWDYLEVLDIASADLSRSPLPLIESHDASKVNIGLVKDLRVDGNKLRGTAVFGTSTRAAELLEDVKAGIVRNVSIGYELVGRGTQIKVGGRDALKFKFRPIEVSIVAVPADPSAGFNRSHQIMTDTTTQPTTRQNPHIEVIENTTERGAVGLERQRVRAINMVAKEFRDHVPQDLEHTAIREGWTAERMQDQVLQRMRSGGTDVTERAFSPGYREGDVRHSTCAM